MTSRQEILEAFKFRHACKQFDASKIIPNEDFEVILEAAHLSPSSFGFEPWHFLVIQNAQMREKLKTVVWGAQGTLPTASHFVAILHRKESMRFDAGHITHMMRDIQKLADDVIEKKRAKYQKFQESDFCLLDNARHLHDWAAKQNYIALANMMTAAALLGIDSCPIEGFDMNSAEQCLAEMRLLDRSQMGLTAMVAFGYRTNPQPVKSRQPVQDIVTWVR